MPKGKGTYGTKVGRPPKKPNPTQKKLPTKGAPMKNTKSNLKKYGA